MQQHCACVRVEYMCAVGERRVPDDDDYGTFADEEGNQRVKQEQEAVAAAAVVSSPQYLTREEQ